MFRAMVDTIEGARSASELKALSQDFLPEINRAMSAVNGLLQDILEVSSKAEPHLEPVRPEAMVETTLSDLFSMQEGPGVGIEYDFRHTSVALADSQKLMRVFLNIASNAVQAMRGSGNLRFSTRNKTVAGKDFVEFSILNTGSVIAQEDLPHLFEAFFTKNKKGGTGLGLAIAKKVVLAHGGTIECRSAKDSIYPKGFVEFLFTVPAGEQASTVNTTVLPAQSSDFRSRLAYFQGKTNHDSTIEIGTLELEKKVLEKLKPLNRKLELLMVDDEQVYKNAIRLHRDRNPLISEKLLFEFANGSEEVAARQLDGAILDVDLGAGSLDGFELAAALRKLFPNAFLCIHSNRTFADDYKTSLKSGADAFLPKPMSYDHFLRFLAQVLHRLVPGATTETVTVNKEDATAPNVEDSNRSVILEEDVSASKSGHAQAEGNCIAVVDDSRAVRISWQAKLRGSPVELFESPEAFFERCKDPSFVAAVKVVVTDYHFGTLSQSTGLDFALKLKSLFSFPVVLSSDGLFNEAEKRAFTAVIPKTLYTAEELDALLKRS